MHSVLPALRAALVGSRKRLETAAAAGKGSDPVKQYLLTPAAPLVQAAQQFSADDLQKGAEGRD